MPSASVSQHAAKVRNTLNISIPQCGHAFISEHLISSMQEVAPKGTVQRRQACAAGYNNVDNQELTSLSI
jgi:hypothetical protein